MNVVKEKVYRNFKILDTWFYENYMALNPEKCNSMCVQGQIYELRLIIDAKLKFDKHGTYLQKRR